MLAPLVAAGLALASLHVALRTGWAPGVVLLAAVALSAAGRQGGERVAPSVAYGTSLAAGASSTVSVVVSALAAHAMITGRHPSVAAAGGYLAGAGLLGIVLAARMRGVVLDRGGLPFPTGAAAAAASRAILRRSDEGGGRRALLVGLGVGGAVALLGPGVRSIAAATGEVGWSRLALPHAIPWLGALLSAMGVGGTWSAFALEASTVPAAVGVLVGPRVAVGVAIGALLGPGVAGSWAVSVGAITGSGFREVVQWTLWPGTGALVAASITGVIAAGRGGGVARTWGMLRSRTTLVAAAAAIALAWGACVWGFGVPALVAFVAVALAA
ncbi:MAG: hypothetical protein D6705_16660, partial [Deltaproteobacteria bacterium]